MENSETEKDSKPYKFERVIAIIGVLILIVQSLISIRQCSISNMQSRIDSTQSNHNDSLFAYTKKRDSIQARFDSISEYFRDSLARINTDATTKALDISNRPDIVYDSSIKKPDIVGNPISVLRFFNGGGGSSGKVFVGMQTVSLDFAKVGIHCDTATLQTGRYFIVSPIAAKQSFWIPIFITKKSKIIDSSNLTYGVFGKVVYEYPGASRNRTLEFSFMVYPNGSVLPVPSKSWYGNFENKSYEGGNP